MIDISDIVPTFSFVVDKGLRPGAGAYTPQQFGDATLVMLGVPFSLRFERNRGQVFVDVGSDHSGWYKLEYVLEFVDNSITQQQLGEPPNPELLSNILEGRWDQVARLFRDRQQVLQLKAFADQKSDSLLTKIFGGR